MDYHKSKNCFAETSQGTRSSLDISFHRFHSTAQIYPTMGSPKGLIKSPNNVIHIMSWSLASFIVYVDLANLHFDEFYRTHSDFFCIVYKKTEQIKKIMRLSVSYNNGQFSDSDIYVHIITVIFSSMWSITSSDRADSSSNWSYVIHRVCKRNM